MAAKSKFNRITATVHSRLVDFLPCEAQCFRGGLSDLPGHGEVAEIGAENMPLSTLQRFVVTPLTQSLLKGSGPSDAQK
jgi:hypothetical protein